MNKTLRNTFEKNAKNEKKLMKIQIFCVKCLNFNKKNVFESIHGEKSWAQTALALALKAP